MNTANANQLTVEEICRSFRSPAAVVTLEIMLTPDQARSMLQYGALQHCQQIILDACRVYGSACPEVYELVDLAAPEHQSQLLGLVHLIQRHGTYHIAHCTHPFLAWRSDLPKAAINGQRRKWELLPS